MPPSSALEASATLCPDGSDTYLPTVSLLTDSVAAASPETKRPARERNAVELLYESAGRLGTFSGNKRFTVEIDDSLRDA